MTKEPIENEARSAINEISWIDIGVNLTNKRFSKDLLDIVKAAYLAKVESIIITGTDVDTSEKAITLIEKLNTFEEENRLNDDESRIETSSSNSTCLPRFYSTAGIHPHAANSWTTETTDRLKTLSNLKSTVAIGETGLDFNRNFSSPKEQESAFEKQLEIAEETSLPLFLHQRDAHTRLHSILKSYRDRLDNVVIHCFTDSKRALFDYLDIDCHIGITGWICDERRGINLQNIVTNIPLNRLMLETDSPYLIPRDLENPPKDKRNEPKFLDHIGRKVASLYNLPVEEFSQQILETTRKFFRLPTTDQNS